jgi:hypothetical protein
LSAWMLKKCGNLYDPSVPSLELCSL